MQGQAVSIDFMAAMVIFILMVAAGFYVVQNSFVPSGGFAQQVEAAADSALDSFNTETEWTVYKTPVGVRSNASLRNEPVTVDVPYPGGIVANSTLAMNGGAEVRSQHNLSTNDTVILTDIREGSTRLDVVYTYTGSMDDRNYTSNLDHGGDSVWNDKLNVTFTANGLSQLSFNGNAFLDAEAHLAGGSSPAFDTRLLRANVTYSSGRKHVRLFEDAGQIRITEFFSGEREWDLNLTSSFDTLYSSEAGGIVNLNSGGTGLYTATTDWVDFNDSARGLSIVGEGMFVNVSRDSSNAKLEVLINFSDSGGRKDLLLYAHTGNYTNATAQKRDFYNPYEAPVGVPEPVEGVSREQANTLESDSYGSIQDTLGLTGLTYNISIDGVFKAGKDVDTSSAVSVLDFPTAVVERYGNASMKDMVMRIWN
ncbi:MAG: hypothetical protein SVW02_00480, partial [Candidatus Nanohaloarchaea archaeon]|nr:hypothetical protein [Candidatus Nanohaloarchaea archaeon]